MDCEIKPLEIKPLEIKPLEIIKRGKGRPAKYETREDRRCATYLINKKYKSKPYHCDVCNKDIALNSKYYHNQTNKKHLKAIENFKTIENLD